MSPEQAASVGIPAEYADRVQDFLDELAAGGCGGRAGGGGVECGVVEVCVGGALGGSV